MKIRKVLGSALIATLLPKSSVHGDAFGQGLPNPPNGEYYKADNWVHTYCYDGGSVSALRKDNMDRAMAYLDDTTDMADQLTTCEASGVDIEFQEFYLDNKRGDVGCVEMDPNDDTVCRASVVRIDTAAQGSPFDHNLDKTIRHEMGHTVGLTHGGSDDAMKQGLVNGDNKWILFTQHHKDHINAAY